MMDYHEVAGQLLDLRITRQIILHERWLTGEFKGELAVLDYLHKHGNKAYPKTLSKEMAVSTARIAVILNHLEKEGHIRRVPDLVDSRKTLVMLNEKGQQFLEECRRKIEEYLVRILEKMGEEDCREFLRLRMKLLKILSEK